MSPETFVASHTSRPSPAGVSGFTQLLLLTRREFAIERRAAAWIGSMGLLAIQEVVILGLGFSFEGASAAKTVYTIGALWLAFLFSGSVGANRSYALEREGGAFAGLLMLPVSPALIYIAKVLSGLICLLASILVMFGVAAILLHLSIGGSLVAVLVVFALASFGYMSLLALLGGLISELRGRDALLGIATLPLAVPLFYVATSATRTLAQGAGMTDVGREFGMLIAFDTVYFALGLLTFEKMVDA